MTDKHPPELIEAVARGMRRNQFERTRRTNSFDPTMPPTGNELDDARAALDAHTAWLAEQGLDQWQPIETAPKDGTFLAFNRMVGVFQTMRKDDNFVCCFWSGHTGTWYPEPTHWQPLPPPPNVSRETVPTAAQTAEYLATHHVGRRPNTRAEQEARDRETFGGDE